MKKQQEVEFEKFESEWVDIDSIYANKYNPNRMTPHDFNMLTKSIKEDGFTMPIVVQKKDRVIVDGEHRWRACKQLGYKEIRVTWVNMDDIQARIATLRHNRARGSEDFELVGMILRDAEKTGALGTFQFALGLDDIETQRLIKSDATVLELAGVEYSSAFIPTDGGKTNEGTEVVHVGTDRGGYDNAMSLSALEAVREREERLKKAKTLEEREQITRDTSTYSIKLNFGKEESTVVRTVLGDRPAEKIYSMCLKELEKQREAA